MSAAPPDREALDGKMNVSRETSIRLETYADLLRKWNPAINLVSSNSMEDMATRHFADSLQLLPLLPPDAQTLLDIGSGGGFPGLVLALAQTRVRVTLVEADARKCAFLRTVARECNATVEIISDRIENVPARTPDVMTSRAFAPLRTFLEMTEHQWTETTTLLLLKGARAHEEIADALECFRFHCERYASGTDTTGTILKLTEIERA